MFSTLKLIQRLEKSQQRAFYISLSLSGIFLVTTIILGKQANKLKQRIKKLKNRKVFTPAQIIKQLKQQHISQQLLDEGNIIQDNQTFQPIFVLKDALIQGVGVGSNNFKAKLSDRILLLSKEITINQYSNQGFVGYHQVIPYSKKSLQDYIETHSKITKFRAVDELYLMEYNIKNIEQAKKQNFCQVNIRNKNIKKQPQFKNQEWGTTKILDDCYDYLRVKTYRLKLSGFESFLNFITGLVQFIILPVNILFFKQPIVRGFKVGEEEHEIGISEGKILTAFGDLVYNFQTNQLKIENVYYLAKDKRGILLKYKEVLNNANSKIISCLFISGCALLICYTILHNAKKKFITYQRRVKQDDYISIEDISMIEQDDDNVKCIVCIDKPRSIIIKPCMHTIICRTCLDSLVAKKCPYCKDKIEGFMDIMVDLKEYDKTIQPQNNQQIYQDLEI